MSQMQVNALHGFVTLTGFCIALVAAITFHEFSHALSATSLGDYTARSLGRLSLHPKVHLDPIGTTMILLAGFGWGKPTPVNPRYLRPGERPGMAAVAMAGPISNVLLAFVATIPMKLGLVSRDYSAFILFRGETTDIVAYVLGALVFWNLLLAAFNLIPVAPLDGFKVVLGILPREPAQQFARLERYGPAILLGLIAVQYLLPGPGILSTIIRPILNLLALVVLGEHVL